MRNLSSVPISRKLPVIIAGISLAASLTVAVPGYFESRASILHETKRYFDVLTAERGSAVDQWFKKLESDMITNVRMPSIVNATQALSSSFTIMTTRDALQASYGRDNPNAIGQKSRLDQAQDAIPYNFQHGAFHPFFRRLIENAGYDDLFLLNTAGDIVYSFAKEPEFATNLLSGPFQDSGLARTFAEAMDGAPEQVYFADFAPYRPSDNAAAAFLSTQVIGTDGEMVGVFAIQIPASQIDQIINKPLGLGATGEMYIAGPDNKTRSNSRFDHGHSALQDVSHLTQVRASLASEPLFHTGVTGINGAPSVAKIAEIEVMGNNWRIIGEMDVTEVMIPVIAMRNKMIVISGLVVIVAGLLGLWTARSVVRPLDRLRAGMVRVASRDYDFNVTDTDMRDELGQLANALVDFRDKLRASDAAEEDRAKVQAEQARVVDQLRQAMVALANGDLTAQITTPFEVSYEQLRLDYNSTVANLSNTVGSVVNSTVGIRERAHEMSAASDDLSRRTENQAATLEQTAAALDELTASVRSAANGAREVETIVANARQDADASEPVVHKAVAAMTAIERSSEEISQIVSVIDDIAFQTNLLALNAGVEAARAGEAGRGFAVVASEVRALAQRSSEAAKQIKTLIAGSSDQVAAGVGLVGQAGEVLTKIARHINHIAGLVSEIAAGAEEQSTGLAEINIGVTQLDKVTQQNAAMVEQATASSHALNGEAGNLGDLVARFRLDTAATKSGGAQSRPAENIMMFQPPRRQPPSTGERSPLILTPVAMNRSTGSSAVAKTDGWKDF